MARSAVTAGRLRKISEEVGIQGIDEIKGNIAKKLDKLTGMQAKRVFMRAALLLVREEKANIHSITGHLAGAIFADYGDPKKPNVLVGTNNRKAPHGLLVEEGHGGPHPAPPHPYHKPAVNATRGIMAATIAEGLKDLVEQE